MSSGDGGATTSFVVSHKLRHRVYGKVGFRLCRKRGTSSLLAETAVYPDRGQAELLAGLDVMVLALRDVEDRTLVDATFAQQFECPLEVRKPGLVAVYV